MRFPIALAAAAAFCGAALAHPHVPIPAATPAVTPAPALRRDGGSEGLTGSMPTSKKTTSSKKSTSTKKTTSKHETTSKNATPTKTTLSTTTTSTSSAAPTSTTPFCGYGDEQLASPTQGQTFYYNETSGDPITIPVLYCSGQYFKTYSISADIWLGSTSSGQILTLEQKPDNEDAWAGYYSYRFNTTVYPADGDIGAGPYQFNFYEVASGYYNAYNYINTMVTINIETTS